MSTVFGTAPAPYVMTLLAGLLGWMFNTAIQDFKDIRIVQYQYEYGLYHDVNSVVVYLYNRSLSGAVEGGQFEISCAESCLKRIPSINAFAQFVKSGNVVVVSSPSDDGNKTVSFRALIPPGGEVAYRVGLAAPNTAMRLIYTPNVTGPEASQNVRIILQEGSSFKSYILNNYLDIVSVCLVIVIAILGAWLLGQFVKWLRSKEAPEGGETVFTVTAKGETFDVIVKQK